MIKPKTIPPERVLRVAPETRDFTCSGDDTDKGWIFGVEMVAYFDESEQENTSFCMAGWFAPIDQWKPLEDQWSAILQKEGVTPEFKMADCFNGKGASGARIRFMVTSIDEEAARCLDRLSAAYGRTLVTAAQEPWETKPGDFGVENWTAISARNALQEVARLRRWGADWLSRQSESVQKTVDKIERELEKLKGSALLAGATDLPSDLPPDL